MTRQLDLFADCPARSATLSDDGLYRYTLCRTWEGSRPRVNFVMLNPSTADAEVDDPTIRRCVGFARSWGFGGLVVTNLFALRSPDPTALLRAVDPIGPENDRHLLAQAGAAACVVCAWGVHGSLADRARDVCASLRGGGIDLHHIGLTKGGHPGHPLYLAADAKLTRWPVGGASP